MLVVKMWAYINHDAHFIGTDKDTNSLRTKLLFGTSIVTTVKRRGITNSPGEVVIFVAIAGLGGKGEGLASTRGWKIMTGFGLPLLLLQPLLFFIVALPPFANEEGEEAEAWVGGRGMEETL